MAADDFVVTGGSIRFSINFTKAFVKFFLKGLLHRRYLMQRNDGIGWHGSNCHRCCFWAFYCRAQTVWDLGALVTGR